LVGEVGSGILHCHVIRVGVMKAGKVLFGFFVIVDDELGEGIIGINKIVFVAKECGILEEVRKYILKVPNRNLHCLAMLIVFGVFDILGSSFKHYDLHAVLGCRKLTGKSIHQCWMMQKLATFIESA
jgi:hypothetical protein